MLKKLFSLKIISTTLTFVIIVNVAVISCLFPQKNKLAKAEADVIGGPAQVAATENDMISEAINFPVISADALSSGTLAAIAVEKEAKSWVEKAIQIAGYILMHQILNMITNDIIAWINGGGKPRFISDWKGFLTSAADKAAGAFLNQLAGINLCEPFSLDLRIALMPTTNFPEEVSCSFSEMGQFFDDFRNEGWKGWVKITSPENNFFGAYFKGIDQRMSAEAAAEKAAENEGIASKGFLGVRCTSDLAAKSGCKAGEIVTPGEVISNMTNKTISKDFDTLQASIADMTDSLGVFAPYVIAIGNALINRVITQGLAMVAGGGGDSEQLQIAIPDAKQATQNITDEYSSTGLKDQEKNLSNTLSNLILPIQKKQEDILVKTASAEKQIMTTIIRSKEENCPLAGVSYTLTPDPDKKATTEIKGKTTIKITPLILTVANIGTAEVENKQITTENSSGDLETSITNTITASFPQSTAKAEEIQEKINQSIQLIAEINEAITAVNKYEQWIAQNNSALNKTPLEISNMTSTEKNAWNKLKLEGDTLRFEAVTLSQAITKSTSGDLQALSQEIQQINTKTATNLKALTSELGQDSAGYETGLYKDLTDTNKILSSINSQLSKCQEKEEL